MNKYLIIIFLFCLSTLNYGQARYIHVYVALCDNEYQGIVRVPQSLGNGKDPARNLYWGAMYGVKTFFKKYASEWQLIKKVDTDNPVILERLLFKNAQKNLPYK